MLQFAVKTNKIMDLSTVKTVVVKIGTSTLTYENGKMNLRRIDKLCRTLCDLQNGGRRIVLVTSGAIGVGMGKLGLPERPDDTAKKQALAAIGQCELMFAYDKFFGEYHQNVAQVLLTADVTSQPISRRNVENTFRELLDMNVIPIVNENDTVAVDELEGRNFGDNDTLSAIVASIVNADVLMILTDIDGVYDKNPKAYPDAKRLSVIEKIDDEVRAMAGGAGSARGTGGMATKLTAAEIATSAGADMIIANGRDFHIIHKLIEGRKYGTLFAGNKKEEFYLIDYIEKLL